MTGLFETKLGITFANKETVLEFNGCSIEAHIHQITWMLAGALDNHKFILLDEADFFRNGEQEDVRYVSERYIAKSDPLIVMVSTPCAPGGLFDSIEKQPEETCIKNVCIRLYLFPLPYLRRTISHLINLILKHTN